jgi:PHD/YefM family antitoxin component YafN of YafNO toxin-antitoxin module
MIAGTKNFSMSTGTNFKTAAEQYIVDKKGNPTAVIIPVENYLSMLEEIEDYREIKYLSKSAEFVRLIRKGLDDIRQNRVSHWKEVWDEL